jgi:DNA-directed RNA polymerase III subunit RPC7
MPSYSGKYQKKKRLVPKLQGRPYGESLHQCYKILRPERTGADEFVFWAVLKFFPRELWPTAQPNFKPDAALDGYIPQTLRSGIKRGFEEDDEDEETLKRRREGDGDGEGGEGEDLEADILDADEDQEEEIVDDDFEDDEDEMGGDYNAEQYFDGGEEDYGDDGFGDGGGGGGDEDTY